MQCTGLILQIPQYHSSVPVLQSGIVYFEVMVLEYHQIDNCILHRHVISHVTTGYVVVRDEKINLSPLYRVKSHSEAL